MHGGSCRAINFHLSQLGLSLMYHAGRNEIRYEIEFREYSEGNVKTLRAYE